MATLIARDSTICRTSAARIERLPPPSFDPGDATRASLPAAAHYLDRIVPLLRAEQREIGSAGRPKTSRDLYASVVNALDAVVRDSETARTAAHARHLEAFRAAARTEQTDGTHLAGVAQQFGLSACTSG